MSVMFFDKLKIEQLYALLEFHFDKIKPVIRSSHYYAKFARDEEKSAGTLKLPFEEDRCETQFIQSILYYATISNWVAHGVQYQVTLDFKALSEIDFDQSPPKRESLKNLLKELKHFYYNMNTNAGHFFIDEQWYRPFMDIMDGLTRLIASEA